jgi:hypothetical protein
MPRKNRGYKRGEPHRDATLFVIACEGAVREKEYFEHLGKYTSRIRVRVLENTHGNSAPKWVMDSAARYEEEIGIRDQDQLWFVIDVDRWPVQQIRSIHEECEKRSNWGIALSNPCFEVWLYLHVDDIRDSKSTTCNELKGELPEKIQGGYNKEKFIPLIRKAHERALELDNNPKHFMPEPMRTKMHLLTIEILNILGANSEI